MIIITRYTTMTMSITVVFIDATANNTQSIQQYIFETISQRAIKYHGITKQNILLFFQSSSSFSRTITKIVYYPNKIAGKNECV